MAFPTDYSLYQDVVIDPNQVPADQYDYVAYIALSDLDVGTSNFWDTTVDGGDIRVTIDGIEVPRELAYIDVGSRTGALFVKVPFLSSTAQTTIRIHYNGIDADYADSDPYGRNAVYTDYTAVWHLDEGQNTAPAGYDDSTGGGANGTGVNMTLPTPPLASGALEMPHVEFNGTSDRIPVNHFYQTTTMPAFTVTAWVKVPLTATSGNWSILDYDRSEYFTAAVGVPNGAPSGAGGDRIVFQTNSNPGGIQDSWGTSTNVVDGSWHFVQWSYDGISNKRVYIDGVLDMNVNAPGPLGDASPITRYGYIGDGSEAGGFGGNANNLYYEGFISDVRLQQIYRDQNWATTQYNNESSPNTFYNVYQEKDSLICNIVTTDESLCLLGDINSVTINIYAAGSIGTYPVLAATTAGTLLATGTASSNTLAVRDVSPAAWHVTNTTAVDIESALSGTYASFYVDQTLLPEDVQVCYVVSDACGTSDEVCDTAWSCSPIPFEIVSAVGVPGTEEGTVTNLSAGNIANFGVGPYPVFREYDVTFSNGFTAHVRSDGTTANQMLWMITNINNGRIVYVRHNTSDASMSNGSNANGLWDDRFTEGAVVTWTFDQPVENLSFFFGDIDGGLAGVVDSITPEATHWNHTQGQGDGEGAGLEVNANGIYRYMPPIPDNNNSMILYWEGSTTSVQMRAGELGGIGIRPTAMHCQLPDEAKPAFWNIELQISNTTTVGAYERVAFDNATDYSTGDMYFDMTASISDTSQLQPGSYVELEIQHTRDSDLQNATWTTVTSGVELDVEGGAILADPGGIYATYYAPHTTLTNWTIPQFAAGNARLTLAKRNWANDTSQYWDGAAWTAGGVTPNSGDNLANNYVADIQYLSGNNYESQAVALKYIIKVCNSLGNCTLTQEVVFERFAEVLGVIHSQYGNIGDQLIIQSYRPSYIVLQQISGNVLNYIGDIPFQFSLSSSQVRHFNTFTPFLAVTNTYNTLTFSNGMVSYDSGRYSNPWTEQPTLFAGQYVDGTRSNNTIESLFDRTWSSPTTILPLSSYQGVEYYNSGCCTNQPISAGPYTWTTPLGSIPVPATLTYTFSSVGERGTFDLYRDYSGTPVRLTWDMEANFIY